MGSMNNLQVLVLRDVCQQFDNPLVSKHFTEILNLKIKGYQTRHSKRFLPFGTHDFFADHLIVCEKETLIPIVCSKVVSYETCLFYNCTFPLLELKSIFESVHWEALKLIIDERVSRGKNISYSGGFTINPLFKALGTTDLLKDIYTGIHYLNHLEQNYSTMMGFGAPRVGTDVFFRKWGVKALQVNGTDVPAVALPFANGLESILMWSDLDQLSQYKKKMGELYKGLWDRRIEFSMKDVRAAA